MCTTELPLHSSSGEVISMALGITRLHLENHSRGGPDYILSRLKAGPTAI